MILDCGFGAIKIWVECNQKCLDEYAQKTAVGTKTEECYIASQEDQEFLICATPVGSVLEQHRVDVYLDGTWLTAKGFTKASTADQPLYLDGVWVSESQKKSFVFGKLILAEDDESDSIDAQTLKNLGTIRVEIQAVTYQPSSPTFVARTVTLPSETPISEKAKKGGAHVTRLGPSKTVASVPRFRTTNIPDSESRDGIFHYAPIELLYAREILERPLSVLRDASPAELGSSSNVDVPVKTE
ncbi:hypothetical protein DL93DRAFT_2234702, partial [Clavulina sp. PMI_390]